LNLRCWFDHDDMPCRDLDRSTPWDQAALPANIPGCHLVAGRPRAFIKGGWMAIGDAGWTLASRVEVAG
jgi:hypothetical protein